jgi:hypothetical protein
MELARGEDYPTMADVKGIYSFTLKDSAKKIRVVDIYFIAHDTDTLSAENINLGNLAALIDPLTDGQIVQQKFSIITPVSGALKSAPNAGSNLEEGGLLTYPMVGLVNRGYSIYIPALQDARELPADETLINLADTNVSAFNTFVSTVGFPEIVDDDWQTTLGAVLRGTVAFRKLRKQTRRHRL